LQIRRDHVIVLERALRIRRDVIVQERALTIARLT
jgi:hypothetical protein